MSSFAWYILFWLAARISVEYVSYCRFRFSHRVTWSIWKVFYHTYINTSILRVLYSYRRPLLPFDVCEASRATLDVIQEDGAGVEDLQALCTMIGMFYIITIAIQLLDIAFTPRPRRTRHIKVHYWVLLCVTTLVLMRVAFVEQRYLAVLLFTLYHGAHRPWHQMAYLAEESGLFKLSSTLRLVSSRIYTYTRLFLFSYVLVLPALQHAWVEPSWTSLALCGVTAVHFVRDLYFTHK